MDSTSACMTEPRSVEMPNLANNVPVEKLRRLVERNGCQNGKESRRNRRREG